MRLFGGKCDCWIWEGAWGLSQALTDFVIGFLNKRFNSGDGGDPYYPLGNNKSDDNKLEDDKDGEDESNDEDGDSGEDVDWDSDE